MDLLSDEILDAQWMIVAHSPVRVAVKNWGSSMFELTLKANPGGKEISVWDAQALYIQGKQFPRAPIPHKLGSDQFLALETQLQANINISPGKPYAITEGYAIAKEIDHSLMTLYFRNVEESPGTWPTFTEAEILRLVRRMWTYFEPQDQVNAFSAAIYCLRPLDRAWVDVGRMEFFVDVYDPTAEQFRKLVGDPSANYTISDQGAQSGRTNSTGGISRTFVHRPVANVTGSAASTTNITDPTKSDPNTPISARTSSVMEVT